MTRLTGGHWEAPFRWKVFTTFCEFKEDAVVPVVLADVPHAPLLQQLLFRQVLASKGNIDVVDELSFQRRRGDSDLVLLWLFQAVALSIVKSRRATESLRESLIGRMPVVSCMLRSPRGCERFLIGFIWMVAHFLRIRHIWGCRKSSERFGWDLLVVRIMHLISISL